MKNIIFLLMLITFQSEAHVHLINPRGGENFTPGDQVIIEWEEVQRHESLNWDILFSKDEGITWDTVKSNIPVNIMSYYWIVPEMGTTKGQIKIVQDNVYEDYEAISENFTISSITGIDTPVETENTYVYPNPLINFGVIRFQNPDYEPITLTLFDRNGQIVKIYTDIRENQIFFERRNLNSGLYIFQLSRNSRIQSSGKLILE